MKKTFAVFFMLSTAALPAFCAASTCETRVDRHQNASTRERVAYCLTPEAEQPLPAGPELVYYGVSSNKPAPQTEEQPVSKKPVYFDKDGVQVAQDYVDTKKFPAFTNDVLSEQERLALEQAAKEEADRQAKLAASAQAPKRLAQSAKLTAPSVLTEEDEKGLLARQKKPKRFMKTIAEEQPEPAPTPASSEETVAQAYSVNPYGTPASGDAGDGLMYAPTGTPQNEIQQAYGLENNPNAAPAYNAQGAAPAGFTDPALASDSSFGYNASDPAMQP